MKGFTPGAVLQENLVIDLKRRPFRHGDAGQMNFYLNYWKDQVMAEGDNPPVGLLLCTDKDQTKVEPSGANRSEAEFASPSPESSQRGKQIVSRTTREGERGGANQYATGGQDPQLFVSRYLVALPKPEQLEQLIEADRAACEQHHAGPSPAEDQP